MDALVLGNHLILRPDDAVPTGKVAERPSIPHSEPTRTQRGVAAITTGIVGSWLLFQGTVDVFSAVFGCIAAFICISALFIPSLFGFIHRRLEGVVRNILGQVTRILFAFVFYGILTPIGLMKKQFSKSPLDPDSSSQLSSVWEDQNWSSDYDRMF